MKQKSVYAFGVVAASRFYRLEGRYPDREGYAEVREHWFSTGGEAGNGALVLARLGVPVRLDGNWVGDDGEGRRLLELYRERGVDPRLLTVKPGQSGVLEMVIADGETRTIFGTYGKLLSGDQRWNDPDEASIRDCDIVMIDPPFGRASETAAELSHKHGKPYVTVDSRPESPICRGAATVVISGEFRDREFAGRAKEAVFDEYRAGCGGLVVFTSGHGDVLFSRGGAATGRTPSFTIDAVDTTGAGDAFRAGMVYGLLEGWDDEKTLRFSGALAALVCLTAPGVLNSPTREEVDAFLGKRS